MPLPTKFFKVTLPLATATTASIITAYLIISTGADKDKSKEEDPALENIELKSKEFEEELIQGPEESEKGEKSDSDPKQKEEGKDALDKEKSKEAPTSAADVAKMLEQVENAVNQMANGGDNDGAKEKHLKIEGEIQASSVSGEERVQEQPAGLEQSTSLSKAQEEKEVPQSVAKTEEGISKELMQGQEENELVTDKGTAKEASIPSDEADQERGVEENQAPAAQDGVEKTLQEDDADRNIDVDQKKNMESDGRDSSGSDSPLDGEDSEPEQATKGENGPLSKGEEGDSDEGSAEINEDIVKRLVELKDEMSGYRGKLQALLRSIG